MPEEINRVLTDQISDMLFTTEASAHRNLQREGIPEERIRFVGNVMIDSLLAHRARAVPTGVLLRQLEISPDLIKSSDGYAVVTLHRPSNVDSPQTLQVLLDTIRKLSERLPVVWPLHPRTRRNAETFGFAHLLAGPRLIILPPLGYLEMLGLMQAATVVLTDSGGIQEETTALAVPCLTLRENTERPVTVEQGTNTVTGVVPDVILAEVDRVMTTGGKRGRTPELWDGRAAERIVAHLTEALLDEQIPVEA
jgi:UDP-N-acetylglucosamine 2-epimerase (non-hydrolysing)